MKLTAHVSVIQLQTEIFIPRIEEEICVKPIDNVQTIYIFHKKIRSRLSTESFLIFLLLSIVIRTIAHCISIVIG